jgi:hypothetical protein
MLVVYVMYMDTLVRHVIACGFRVQRGSRVGVGPSTQINRYEVLGGLIHKYERAA